MVERLRFTIEGDLGAGLEQWSSGCAFRPAPGFAADPADVQGWCENIYNAAATVFPVAVLNRMSSGCRITGVRAQYYGPSGPALYSGFRAFTTPLAGQGTISMPPQCSMVVSLLTSIAGRKFRGRMYWPNLAGSMTSSMKLTVPAGTATGFATMLNEIASRYPGPDIIEPAVYSAVDQALTSVTSVRVGDVVDTQRRRRDALTEIYQEAAL